MTGEPDLRGLRVLIVEDEYFIATHIARALQGAGADVMGPSPTEKAACAQLKDERPDAVVLDINLGSGPSFKLAKTLKGQGIPFVFLTGYGEDVIPEEFKDIDRLEKPIQLRHIVSAISKLQTQGQAVNGCLR
jgi:DNA-binding response OmpR family regulator